MKPLQGIRKLQFITSLSTILAIFIASSPAWGQEFLFKGSRKKNRLSFTLVKNLIVVPIYLNNTGPFNFILDTGVSLLIVTDASITDSLGLKYLRPAKIIGLGKGPDIDALITTEMSVAIGKAKIQHIPAAILKKDFLGLSNYLGIKIHGLLGYYFFNSFIVSINYPSQVLRFSLPDPKMKFKGEQIPFKLISNKPYINVRLEVTGSGVNDTQVLVDNGAGHAISLERWKGKAFPLPKKVIDANLGNGLSGSISGKIGRLTTLAIGSFTFREAIASFPMYDDVAAKALLLNRNGNLGADLLSRFNTTFDYKNGNLYLSKNVNFKRPFDHDMSGLEIYVKEANNKRFFVARIEPKSPGEESGVEENDEILAINFSSTERMDLNEITRMFRSGDGKSMLLTLNRKGELLFKYMRLKRRI
ncbi:MAG: aspartyl protease family protein [Pedobacter sp.]|nr:aspartyl protease family protein [Pedobacter sp.]